MVIEPKDCVVSKERFMELCEEKKKKDPKCKSWPKAFRAVVDYLDEEGYRYPYTSFESFENRLYGR